MLEGYGYKPFHNATLNATPVQIGSGEGKLVKLKAYNVRNTDIHIQIFNSTAAPTPGTTVPDLSILIPNGDLVVKGIGGIEAFPTGIDFSLGIWIAATDAIDGAALAAGSVPINALYL